MQSNPTHTHSLKSSSIPTSNLATKIPEYPTWAALNARLRAYVRDPNGKRCRPTAAILDSQSVKSDAHGGAVGYDAAKQIKGRQRHLLVDTLGLVLGLKGTPASTPERDGAKARLPGVLGYFTWLRLLWVDGGYSRLYA